MTTQQTNLELVRQACIAANPDILKLEFGCEVWIDDIEGEGQYSIWEYIGDVDIHSNQDTLWKCAFSTFATVKWGNFKLEGKPHVLLGRPIRLADVLLAVIYVAPHKDESPMQRDVNERLIIQGDWNLFKDDLRSQSDETVAFLAELLK